jgi:hypothetical protein
MDVVFGTHTVAADVAAEAPLANAIREAASAAGSTRGVQPHAPDEE